MNPLTFFGWGDIFWKLHNENSKPKKSGQGFLSGFKLKIKGIGITELKIRSKTKKELFNVNGIYTLQSKMKQYYTFTMKNILFMKLKPFIVNPNNERGWIYQVQSLQLNRDLFFGVLGAVYYDTGGWNSILYLIEPKLKGEFNIQPYYLTGISLYSKLNFEIDQNNLFSLRCSLKIKSEKNWVAKSNIAIQLDIVF